MKSSPKAKNKKTVYKKVYLIPNSNGCRRCGSTDIKSEQKKGASKSLKIWTCFIFAIAIIMIAGLLTNISRGNFSFATHWPGLLASLAIGFYFMHLFLKIRKRESTYRDFYTCRKCSHHWYKK